MSTRPHFRQSSPRLEKKTRSNGSIEAALKPYLVDTGVSKIKLIPRQEHAIRKKTDGS